MQTAEVAIDLQAADALRAVTYNRVAFELARAMPRGIWPAGACRDIAGYLLAGMGPVDETPEARAYMVEVESADPDLWDDDTRAVRSLRVLAERQQGEGASFAYGLMAVGRALVAALDMGASV